MQISSQKLPKSKIELTIEVPFDDVKNYLTESAKNISLEIKMPGFRPGHIPYDVIKQKVGELAIYENAASKIIAATLPDAFAKEKLEVIGEPKVEIKTLEIGKPFIYKATLSLIPKVKLGDYKSQNVEKKEIKVLETEIEKVLSNIQEQNVKEAIKQGDVKKTDKVNLDINLSLEKVPLEGGQLIKQDIIAGQEIFPEGFNENLIGAKKLEEKEFEIDYPQNHFDKKLAGKTIQFKIKINEIYERILPEINDDFAKSMGEFKNIAELKEYAKNIILQDKQRYEKERFEGELLEILVKNAEFEEIPEILIDSEKDKMVQELKANIESKGGSFEDYLSHIKKTEEDLRKDFEELAAKRIKTVLAIRNIAAIENVEVNDEEIDKEIEKTLKTYENDYEITNNVKSQGYRNYLKNIMLNRKVIDKLKSWNTQ